MLPVFRPAHNLQAGDLIEHPLTRRHIVVEELPPCSPRCVAITYHPKQDPTDGQAVIVDCGQYVRLLECSRAGMAR